MDSTVQLVVGVFFAASGIGYLSFIVARRARISNRVLGDMLVEHQNSDHVQFAPIIEFIEARFAKTSYFTWLRKELEIGASRVSPARHILDSAVLMVVAVLFGAWLQGLAGALAALILVGAIRGYLPTIQVGKRRAKFQDQLDYTLSLFTASIRAGHSLIRAIEIVAIQSEAPTSQEFSRALNAIRLGRDMGDSMMGIAERMKSQELEWVVQSINIHREAGGNLTEMFETVVATIKDRNSIRVLIRTLSTDGRVSGQVMSILPLGIILVFGLMNPANFAVFLTTPVGNILLAIAATLYLAGVLWIRKIVKVNF